MVQVWESLDFWLGLSLVTAGSVGLFLMIWNDYQHHPDGIINIVITVSFYSLLVLFILAGFFWMKLALRKASE